MGDRRAFLRWFVVVLATSAAIFIMGVSGFMHSVWVKDSSYLSATTLAFFLVVTAILGRATWRATNMPFQSWVKDGYAKVSNKYELKELRNIEEVGWFASELCLVLGMLGTIIGFVLMLAGFETLNIKDVTSIQGLLGDLGKSMATALYTTLVGLICGSILKVQCFNLGLEIKAKLEEE